MSVVESCAITGTKLGDITPRPAMPGSQREISMESLPRRRAQEEKPKLKMVRVYFTLLVAKTVTKQQIAMAVIER